MERAIERMQSIQRRACGLPDAADMLLASQREAPPEATSQDDMLGALGLQVTQQTSSEALEEPTVPDRAAAEDGIVTAGRSAKSSTAGWQLTEGEGAVEDEDYASIEDALDAPADRNAAYSALNPGWNDDLEDDTRGEMFADVGDSSLAATPGAQVLSPQVIAQGAVSRPGFNRERHTSSSTKKSRLTNRTSAASVVGSATTHGSELRPSGAAGRSSQIREHDERSASALRSDAPNDQVGNAGLMDPMGDAASIADSYGTSTSGSESQGWDSEDEWVGEGGKDGDRSAGSSKEPSIIDLRGSLRV